MALGSEIICVPPIAAFVVMVRVATELRIIIVVPLIIIIVRIVMVLVVMIFRTVLALQNMLFQDGMRLVNLAL